MRQYTRWSCLWDVRIILKNDLLSNHQCKHSCGPAAEPVYFVHCIISTKKEKKRRNIQSLDVIHLLTVLHANIISTIDAEQKLQFDHLFRYVTAQQKRLWQKKKTSNNNNNKKQCSKEAKKHWRRHAKLLVDTAISLSSNLFEREDSISTEQNTRIHMRDDPNGCWFCKAIHFLWIAKSKCCW